MRQPPNLSPQEALEFHGWEVTGEGCWEYSGSRHAEGYGAIQHGKTKVRASRVAYSIWVGELSDVDKVLHTCDNPPCINPDHLFKGTQADNVADMIAKGRNKNPTPLPGDKSPNRKLTQAIVLSLRERYSKGETMTAMAAEYDMSIGGISLAINGKNWRQE